MSRPYYVYALKDPRQNPATAFYIGKGTGSRAWQHVLHVDETLKGQRISKFKTLVPKLPLSFWLMILLKTKRLKLKRNLFLPLEQLQPADFLQTL